jgi:glycosyltransferase involved in cell wall biosynthesis
MMNKGSYKVDIIMPTFNGSKTIVDTLNTITSQTYQDFKIIIFDDASTDDTIEIVNNFEDQRIQIFSSDVNLGYPGAIKKAYSLATAPLVFLMAQDDYLADSALEDTVTFFELNPDAGAMTRPYYAFDQSINKPIRFKNTIKSKSAPYEIISTNSDFHKIHLLLNTLDQLSGLCLRRSAVKQNFGGDVFTSHVIPFLSVLDGHKIGFMNKYTIAVRVNSSMTISEKSIYDRSPVSSWLDVMNQVFYRPEFKKIKKEINQKFVCSNWIGLFQIRNYSSYPFKYLFREYWLMLRIKPLNFINPFFLLTMALCIFIPRKLLIIIVNSVKNNISSKFVKKISFVLNGKDILSD